VDNNLFVGANSLGTDVVNTETPYLSILGQRNRALQKLESPQLNFPLVHGAPRLLPDVLLMKKWRNPDVCETPQVAAHNHWP